MDWWLLSFFFFFFFWYGLEFLRFRGWRSYMKEQWYVITNDRRINYLIASDDSVAVANPYISS